MAGSRSSLSSSSDVGILIPARGRRLARGLKLAVWALAASIPLETQAGVSVRSETSRAGMGVSSMAEAQSGSLLVEYFKDFSKKRDVDEFRDRVAARYNEGTLEPNPGRLTRRVGAASRGACPWGCWELSSKATRFWVRLCAIEDLAVRSMAEDALWAIWFRADTPEHNQRLEQVRHSIGREQLEQAETLVTRLIADAPNFAEAYNQRAFVYFLHGPIRRERRGLPAGSRSQPVSHWGHRGIGEVPARSEPSSRRTQVVAPRLQASTAQQALSDEHPRARNADRVRRAR